MRKGRERKNNIQMFATAAIIGKRSSKSAFAKSSPENGNERQICRKCESSKLQTKCTQLTPEMHTQKIGSFRRGGGRRAVLFFFSSGRAV